MKKRIHRIYISTLVIIVIITLVLLSIMGYDYYQTDLSERFYHEQHDIYKSSGLMGHGIGILGTLLILIGVFGYMARKRYRSLSRLGLLKHWLEFHIFLCTEGAILILFHTAFKFGGIVAISFWSMVAVVISGIIGRFIYIQIPRTIEGRALSLQEAITLREESSPISSADVQMTAELKQELTQLMKAAPVDQGQTKGNVFTSILSSYQRKRAVKKTLKKSSIARSRRKSLYKKLAAEINLDRKIKRLEYMQTLFKYWHVAHLPFALVMLIIAIIHVGVTLLFGYKWIF